MIVRQRSPESDLSVFLLSYLSHAACQRLSVKNLASYSPFAIYGKLCTIRPHLLRTLRSYLPKLTDDVVTVVWVRTHVACGIDRHVNRLMIRLRRCHILRHCCSHCHRSLHHCLHYHMYHRCSVNHYCMCRHCSVKHCLRNCCHFGCYLLYFLYCLYLHWKMLNFRSAFLSLFPSVFWFLFRSVQHLPTQVQTVKEVLSR